MTEQIGLMVAHEPHTDPQTMIEELQWELSSQREAWLQIVADKDAEIQRLTNAGLDAAYGETMKADEANDYHAEVERLRAQLTQVEEICQIQSANLQRYAANELEHNRRAAELRAKLEDLHDKNVAAQEELHELRPLTRWQPVDNKTPIICACADSECNVTIWAAGGKILRMESGGVALEMVLPSDVGLMIQK